MASLIGAVAHDLDHPGVNQHFLISTSNHLAILYQVSWFFMALMLFKPKISQANDLFDSFRVPSK